VLAGVGTRQDVIAECVGVDPETLRRHYREELDHGMEIANCQVIETAFRMAVSGRCPAATFFWLKTQMNWREVDRVEHDHRHRGLVGVVPVSEPVPLHMLTQATLDAVEADLLALPPSSE